MKFTKIVATVNASTCTPELLLALYKNGMDVVRFNTAHMEVGEMDRAVAMVRRVSDKLRSWSIRKDRISGPPT